jgi:hypothetical protein
MFYFRRNRNSEKSYPNFVKISMFRFSENSILESEFRFLHTNFDSDIGIPISVPYFDIHVKRSRFPPNVGSLSIIIPYAEYHHDLFQDEKFDLTSIYSGFRF